MGLERQRLLKLDQHLFPGLLGHFLLLLDVAYQLPHDLSMIGGGRKLGPGKTYE